MAIHSCDGEAGRKDRERVKRKSMLQSFSAKCTSDKHHTLTGAETVAALLKRDRASAQGRWRWRERKKTFSSLMNRYQFK